MTSTRSTKLKLLQQQERESQAAINRLNQRIGELMRQRTNRENHIADCRRAMADILYRARGRRDS